MTPRRVAILAGAALALGVAGATGATPPPRAFDSFPKWSPDGRWISFHRVRADPPLGRDYVVRRDGTGRRRIYGGTILWAPSMKHALIKSDARLYLAGGDALGRTLVHRLASGVTWAPDGKRFAFTDFRSGDLHVATVSPFAVRDFRPPVEVCEQCVVVSEVPVWSPDGRSIAVEVSAPFIPPGKNVPSFLYLFDVQTSEWRQLTDAILCQSELGWSADSLLLAFATTPDCDFSETSTERLYVVAREGGAIRAVTAKVGAASFEWAPRGVRLAVWEISSREFGLGGHGRATLVVRDRSGKPLARFPDVYDEGFDWAPDGRQLVFARGTRRELTIGDASSGRLIARLRTGASPAWSPAAGAITYVVGGCSPASGIHVVALATRLDRQVTRPCSAG